MDELAIAKILAGNRTGSTVRVWSTGFSTGEEAYSLAILFQERLTIMEKNCKVQIFATDIDNRAIAVARRLCQCRDRNCSGLPRPLFYR